MSAMLAHLAACSNPPPEAAPKPDEPNPRDHTIVRPYDSTILAAYPAPEGFTRVPASPFVDWARAHPVAPLIQPILTHRGEPVLHPGRLLRLGLSGPQQLGVQSAIRVTAEWRRHDGLPVVFHTRSGQPMPFEGKDWEGYLRDLYPLVDADSVRQFDMKIVQIPEPGDVLFQDSSGHAAVVLDVATHGEDRVLLLGEGFEPAQYFHVEHGPTIYWWPWDPTAGVQDFHTPLPASGLHRWSPRP